MTDITRRKLLGTISAMASTARVVTAAPENDLTLWYKQPAAIWTDALPVGNGRLGAMVFGGIEIERLQLNEDTLWSGSPKDWNNPDAKKYLPEVRRLVLEDKKYSDADAVCRKMQGPYNQSYQPLGNLSLKFRPTGATSNYRRELHVERANAVTLLIAAGTGFKGFENPPDARADEIAARCSARLSAAANRPYARMRAEHVSDHQKLFRRVSLDLGQTNAATLPTDER